MSISPKVDAMIDATVTVIVAFEHGHDLRKPLSDLSIRYHEMQNEHPCIRCDQWTKAQPPYCETCQPFIAAHEKANSPIAENRRIFVCSRCAVSIVADDGDACHDCLEVEAG